MPAGNFVPYYSFPFRVARGDIDFLTDTVKMLLLGNAHTPSQAHTTLADISSDEIEDGDYSRQTLGSKTITQDGSNRTVYDAADVDFGDAVTIAARYAAIFVDNGSPESGCWLIGYIDLNDGGSANVSSTSSDFDVGFNAAGMYRQAP